MSVYVAIEELPDLLPEQWPSVTTYHALEHLPDEQFALWRSVHLTPLAEWLSPFKDLHETTAIYMGVTLDNLIVVSSVVESQIKNHSLEQAVRAQQGYMHRTFGIGHNKPLDAAWLSGVYSSPQARKKHFVAKNLHAFNQIDLKEGFNHVGMGTSNAGAYVWMRYGATVASYDDRLLKSTLSVRWNRLVHAAQTNNLRLDAGLEDFAHTKLGDIAASDFRGIFNAHSKLRRQTLKALLMGDIGFLRNHHHYYAGYHGSGTQFMEPLACNLQFLTQDPDFQAHLSAATKHALKV